MSNVTIGSIRVLARGIGILDTGMYLLARLIGAASSKTKFPNRPPSMIRGVCWRVTAALSRVEVTIFYGSIGSHWVATMTMKAAHCAVRIDGSHSSRSGLAIAAEMWATMLGNHFFTIH